MKRELAAETAIDPGAHRINADLTGQIDHECTIQCQHLLVLRDFHRIVRVLVRVQLKERIIFHVGKIFEAISRMTGNKALRMQLRIARGNDPPTNQVNGCLLYTSPSPRDATLSRMPSSA